MEQNIYIDEHGKEYVLDERGNHIPPMQLTSASIIKSETPNGWDTYDTSQGHCALCGSLTCRGYCVQGGS